MHSPSQHLCVTGAAGGIGRAVIAHATARYRAITAIDQDTVDIRDEARVRQVVARAENQHGPIDALIHVAGVMQPDRCLEEDHSFFGNQNFEVNIGGTIAVVSPIAQAMCARRRGSIVVVSSNAATTPRIGMASYGASKAAVTAWTRTLGLECARYDVRCNIVSPGSTLTPMLTGMWPDGVDASERVIAGTASEYRLGIPLQKLAQPDDIAHACLFLVSPESAHITMHDLRIDGGATLDS
ncbi:SDR family oxidoreductase [Corynebacterium sp. ES2794-CONJ1]|uniref:SDR family oxidoreductase n=1 Tax=unclassified Corynebacterium TaxID=2624378 RepID=UPI002169A1F4|nr:MULTISPECIES: SDR family oxidoreductase [unclassified Corynebacterium]MCS4489634.1 SDR family oxidoreductase [Corynebacterium sp. ES2775-CONJ]MCS4531545.1 SDR family oxidoreductase [Corynebacterium sp. ES2730-CONJ]MCU9518942.1 SDR family oxidoreductase [Corynebacterium sp. ES2794-CONJ1]